MKNYIDEIWFFVDESRESVSCSPMLFIPRWYLGGFVKSLSAIDAITLWQVPMKQ